MKYYLLFALLSFSLKAGELKLIGTHLAEFSIFKIDIYQISYYKGGKDLEEMRLDYKTNVKRKYSIMGWEEGLKHILKEKPEYKSKYDWIVAQVVDLKKGDLYVIRKEKNTVSMLKNGKLLAKIEDEAIASLVYEPWIGSKPVDDKLKKDLLRNSIQ